MRFGAKSDGVTFRMDWKLEGYVSEWVVISRNRHAPLIERFGGKADFVVPVNGERVERKIAEVVHILQFAADAFLHQWGKVYKLHRSIVEGEFQDVVADILCNSNYAFFIIYFA